MSNTLLSILLIGFATVFLLVILAWGTFGKIFGLGATKALVEKTRYSRLKRIHVFYRIILILFTLSSGIYLLFPAYRSWFYPFQWLNNDYVNITGLIVLCIAFFLVVRNQVQLDKNLHLYYFSPNESVYSHLVPETEKHLLKSILLVFLGMFIVVSTAVTGLLLFASLIVYYLRSSSRQYKIRSPFPL